MPVSAPEAAYRAWWVWWSIYAGLGAVTVLALAFLAARLWLVNPLIRSSQESAGRIVRAVETKVCK